MIPWFERAGVRISFSSNFFLHLSGCREFLFVILERFPQFHEKRRNAQLFRWRRGRAADAESSQKHHFIAIRARRFPWSSAVSSGVDAVRTVMCRTAHATKNAFQALQEGANASSLLHIPGTSASSYNDSYSSISSIFSSLAHLTLLRISLSTGTSCWVNGTES